METVRAERLHDKLPSLLLDLEPDLAADLLNHLAAHPRWPYDGMHVVPAGRDRLALADIVVTDLRGGLAARFVYMVASCTVVVLYESPRDVITLAAGQNWRGGAVLPASSTAQEIAEAIMIAHQRNALLLPGDLWPYIQSAAAVLAPLPDGRRHGLTDRQVDVLQALTDCLSNQEIAARLHISEPTVGYHLKKIFDVTGCQSREELILHAVRHGLASEPAWLED